MYMSFSFACNKIISNPAAGFFDKPVIVGDNIEMGIIYSQSLKPESKIIEEYVGPVGGGFDKTGFPQKMKDMKVKYFVLTKETDWQNYLWLDELQGIGVVKENDEYKLYENLLWADTQ